MQDFFVFLVGIKFDILKFITLSHNAHQPRALDQWKVLLLNVGTVGFKSEGSSYWIKYNHTKKS